MDRESAPAQGEYRRALYLGTAVTTVFTGIFGILPLVVPLEGIKTTIFELTGTWIRGNPFTTTRLLGGVVGGVVTGALLDVSWDKALPTVVRAVLYGLGFAYVLVVFYQVIYSVLYQSSVPIYSILFVPLMLVLPLTAVYCLGGIVGGVVGTWIRSEFFAE